MIYLYSQGRMGNQFFQYSAAKGLQKKCGDEKIGIKFTIDEDQLKNFNTNYEIVDKIKLSLIQKFIVFNFWAFRGVYSRNNMIRQQKIEMKFQSFLNYFGIYWNIAGYYDLKKSKFKNKLMYGYYESYQYFDNVDSIIKKEFIPKNPELEKNKKLYDKIINSESVFVGVRRGDFVKIDNIVCDNDYYEKAFNIIQMKVKNPVYIVFSDDIEWARKNIKIPGEVYYEDGNDPIWETIRLMYNCKHFIMNNSTLHWWAQHLSKNKNKIVIAPRKWRNYDIYTDYLQKDWVVIDN